MRKKGRSSQKMVTVIKYIKKSKNIITVFFTLSHLVSRGLGPEAICTLEEAGIMSI
jgi:hypothetical protein